MPNDMTTHLSNALQAAGTLWSAGGKHYDEVSFAISDALAHAAQRLNAQPDHDVLDVATGTGWSARNAARGGARVSAIDIAPKLLEAAQQLSALITPRIDYRLAPAEQLPFADQSFDRVISTFGVIFAADQKRAAAELGRVCRKGGRLCMTAWTPDGAVAEFFGLIAAHSGMPASSPSPLSWGDPAHAESLLGRDFSLRFEHRVSSAYYDNADDIWHWYLRGFGPLRALHESLGVAGRRALKRDVDAYHNAFAVEAGLKVQREYLLIIGERR